MVETTANDTVCNGNIAGDNILRLSSEESTCVVCLGDYEDGELLKVLPCQHHFHKSCIDEWLFRQKTCPLCIQEVIFQHELDQVI